MDNVNKFPSSYVDDMMLQTMKGKIRNVSCFLPQHYKALTDAGFTKEEIIATTDVKSFGELIENKAAADDSGRLVVKAGTLEEQRSNLVSAAQIDWAHVYDKALPKFRLLWGYWEISYLRFTDDSKSAVDEAASLAAAKKECECNVNVEALTEGYKALQQLRDAIRRVGEVGLGDVLTTHQFGLTYTGKSGSRHNFNLNNLKTCSEEGLEEIVFDLLKEKYVVR